MSIQKIVDRFLSWRLPEDFGPDCGIAFNRLAHPNSWPVGTNLLTAVQARAMVEHVLATDETEFNVYVGDEWQAGTSGPREQALAEARHYAAQYVEDGPVRIEEVVRWTVETVGR